MAEKRKDVGEPEVEQKRARIELEQSLPVIRPPSPVRGNDEKSLLLDQSEKLSHVDHFFAHVIASKPKRNVGKLTFIVINHIVPTLPPFLRALSSIGRVAVVIPKQSHHDEVVFKEIQTKKYTIADTYVTREWLAQENNAINFINRYVSPDEKFMIIDIGGYFAMPLQIIASHESFKSRFLGVVEDTENGHQKYQAAIRKAAAPICPLVSVARCELKETEDYNVGKSIVEGAGIILRTDGHTMLERMHTIGVIGFGKIGKSIAEHLRQKHVREVIVYDKDVIRQMKASSLGFKVVNKDVILQSADMIFGATGTKSLEGFDFFSLRDNVFIASCTSHDDEFDLEMLQSYGELTKFEQATINTDKYYLHGRRINLLYKGDAVNFVHGAVNGPYIYSVQAGLIVAAIGLINQEIKTTDTYIQHDNVHLPEITKADMQMIAQHWLVNFENFKHESTYHINNENLFDFLSENEDINQRAMAYYQFANHLYRGCRNLTDKERVQPFIEFLYQSALNLSTHPSLNSLKEKVASYYSHLSTLQAFLSEEQKLDEYIDAANKFLGFGLVRLALYICNDASLRATNINHQAILLLIKLKVYNKLNGREESLIHYVDLCGLNCDSAIKQEALVLMTAFYPQDYLAQLIRQPSAASVTL